MDPITQTKSDGVHSPSTCGVSDLTQTSNESGRLDWGRIAVILGILGFISMCILARYNPSIAKAMDDWAWVIGHAN